MVALIDHVIKHAVCQDRQRFNVLVQYDHIAAIRQHAVIPAGRILEQLQPSFLVFGDHGKIFKGDIAS